MTASTKDECGQLLFPRDIGGMKECRRRRGQDCICNSQRADLLCSAENRPLPPTICTAVNLETTKPHLSLGIITLGNAQQHPLRVI